MAVYIIKCPYSVIGEGDRAFYESHGFEFDVVDGRITPKFRAIEKKFRKYKELVNYLKSIPMSTFLAPDTIVIFPRPNVRLLWSVK